MKKFLLIISLSASFLLTGCIGVNSSFREMSTGIINKFGNEYHKEVEVSVGSFMITFASWVVDFSQEDEIVDDLMRQVSNVQVGVYSMIEEKSDKKKNIFNKINKEMLSKGWKHIIKSYNDDEMTIVYISTEPEMLFKKMFVITHDSEQLVLVEIEGKLDKLIALAIQDKRFEFDI